MDVQRLQSELNILQKNVSAFREKGNKAAGTRARQGLQELKRLAAELRNELMDEAKALKG